MTKDDVIRMAREAGLHLATDVKWMPIIGLEYAEKFAALVAAHTLANIDPSKFMSYQEVYEAGQFAEREACAEICDRFQARDVGMQPAECAGAIRARGKND